MSDKLKDKNLDDWFNKFTSKMYARLVEKEKAGFFGWNQQGQTDVIKKKLYRKLIKLFLDDDDSQTIDISNLVMFLDYRRR